MSGVLRAELLKIYSVRFTAWTLSLAAILAIGVSYLMGLNLRHNIADRSAEQLTRFDSLFAAFYSLTLAQLPLVVFGVLVVGSEISTGTIRAALAATPQRGTFYVGKVLAVALPVACLAIVTVPVAFTVAQLALGPHGMTLGDDGVLGAMAGSWIYLTLIVLFAAGFAMITGASTRAIGIMLPVFFLGSQGLGNVPYVREVAQYLPDQAGMVIMHVAGPQDDPAFAHSYGPWVGLGIVALWTTVALVGGWLVLRRRDV
ncbi:ABC transporter permease [Actinobacteria bacterium YIM 96077]|uniref:ABC transporter permease n=1 Tax=Phytoactinopolyspora halophila TaxID=1981511 RepID=A0A329QBP7_9ACTN|nr:ABC transporter permease subunit [Phytoactinopolyspora halophila]AYY11809.1 ABC transporter permease [Actinobacteria bacterium YIM 96077]RAW09830.1 ABC transporter permease [Phytoactinopolyspora halophila]